MQGLVVVGLIFEEIPNINIKCVKVTGVHNIGQGHQVKVPVESVHREEVLYKVWWLICLFVLRFYGPVNPMGSCRARSVYLTTRLLGRLSPLSG